MKYELENIMEAHINPFILEMGNLNPRDYRYHRGLHLTNLLNQF